MSDGTVRGKIHFIDETKTYGQKGFRKRLVVLEQEKERFTNYVPVELTYDACDAADAFNVGDELEIEFRLSGRKWQRDSNSEVKYFLNAEATNFKVLGGGDQPSAAGNAGFDPNDAFAEAADDDEVPF